MTATITIAHLQHHCHLIGKAADAAPVARELQQLSTEYLPGALNRALTRHLQGLLDGPGVLSIRRLQVRLRVLRRDWAGQQLSEQLAEQLAADLARQLSQSSDNWRYFASPADYCAQLIADLLQGRTESLWAYREYPALRHLETGDAAVQLLLPRLAELPELAAILRQADALPSLVACLHEDRSRQLLHHWCQADPSQLFGPQDALLHHPDPWQLAKWRPATDIASGWLASGLQQWLGALTHVSHTPAQLRQALWRQTQRAFVQHYRHWLRIWLLRETSAPPPNASQRDRALISQLQAWLESQPTRREYLHRALHHLDSEALHTTPRARATTADSVTEQTAERTPGHQNRARDCDPSGAQFSEHAGGILLLPVIVGLGLHCTHNTQELRHAVQMAAGPTAADSPPEPWLLQLLPDQDCGPSAASLPPRWQLGLGKVQQQRIESLCGTAQLAALLLGQFAARLSGLQQSSDTYLREQFLQRPGWYFCDPAPAPLRMQLAPMPLGIVLRMGGFADWGARLPWLQRSLQIHLQTP